MPNASPVPQHHKPHTPEKDSKSSFTGNGHVSSNGLTRMSSYSLELKMDAIDRIQTQVNLNRATLENNNRNIDKIMQTLESITMHYNTLLDRVRHWEDYASERQKEMVALRQELGALKHNPTVAHGGSGVDDKTLEILSGNLATVSSKANEVDNLKFTVELLKRRLARVEEQSGLPPERNRDHIHSGVNAGPQASPPTMSHPQHEARAPTSSYQQGPADHRDPRDPREQRQHDAEMAAGGNWQGATQKRPHVNGIEAAHAVSETPSKRPRLAPLEPRRPYEDTRYDAAARHREAEEHYRRTESGDYSRHADHAAAAAAAAAAHQQHATQYYDRDPRDPAAQRDGQHYSPTMAHSPTRDRPSTSGRGAPGRPRKYPDERDHRSWEQMAANVKAGRQMVVDGQVVAVTPNGQWFALGTADSRRSSVAGHSVGPTLSPATQASPRSSIGGPVHAGQILSQVPRDPYAHTKKTRTKPVRNSEGVLIRKDGRPDMRSQSSAANLRKVHARKEEERRIEAEGHRAASSQIGDEQSEMAGDDHSGSPGSTPQPYSRHHHHYQRDDEDDEGEMKPPGSRGSGSARGPVEGGEVRDPERGMRDAYPRGDDDERRSYTRSEMDDQRSSARSLSASAHHSGAPSPAGEYKDGDRMIEDEKKPTVELLPPPPPPSAPSAAESVEAITA